MQPQSLTLQRLGCGLEFALQGWKPRKGDAEMRKLATISMSMALLWVLHTTPYAMIASQRQNQSPELKGPAKADGRTSALIADEVRHQLVMMPYYGVFDWLEGEAQPNGTVTLRGEVTRPTTKSDAEARLKKLESVSKVVNQIEVLPPSPTDDAIRIAMYRAIFKYDGALFRYATLAVPPIHIIVKNGRVALKGYVASDMDKQLAYTAARNVSGVFEVKNELMVDKDNY
jgi:hyperosmotically inducible protein